MATKTLLATAVLLTVLVVADGLWWFRPPPACLIRESCETVRSCSKCDLFSNKFRNVTLRITNNLREPRFTLQVNLPKTRASSLYYMMEEAANANTQFRFTATFWGGDLGYFIESLNKVMADSANSEFWEILDGNLAQTQLGASSYVPANNEVVTFNLTTWS